MRQSASVAGRRYLALVFPWLSIERLRGTRPHLFAGQDDAPVALTEQLRGAIRLAALDLNATSLGLTAGLTLADARARVPELVTFTHEPLADRAWLERLADGCMRYTPVVALAPPDALTLDIAGCTHAYDGERRLAADVVARLSQRGVIVRHAFADTSAAALALARHIGTAAGDERRAVKRLPASALGLTDDITTALTRAGLKTVGDIAARPMAVIAARFGDAAVSAIQNLTGEMKSPVTPRRHVDPVAVERRFAEPVARTDHILDILGELVAEAADTLEKRHKGGRAWRTRLFRSDGAVQTLTVETGRPTRDAGVLMRLFRERIDALADPLDPGFGYDMIRLDVTLAERLDAAQLKLEGGALRSEAVEAMVDRLSTRLGREHVRRFAPADSHIPEQAELTLPAVEHAAETPASCGWGEPEPGEPPLRPVYLFDPPQRIDAVMAEIPDGPPRRFRWRRNMHEVARAEGPERIAGEWWRRRDGHIPARDYYRIEDRRGRRFWIFRLGLYEETGAPEWYLHGMFA